MGGDAPSERPCVPQRFVATDNAKEGAMKSSASPVPRLLYDLHVVRGQLWGAGGMGRSGGLWRAECLLFHCSGDGGDGMNRFNYLEL